MQLTDAFCYALLTISVTVICIQAENLSQELSERKTDRRMRKRETAIIIDNFPLEAMFSKKPKVIYKRISKQRYSGPKPKYGSPRPKYSPSTSRKPFKKNRGKNTRPKFNKQSHKKRLPKPKYGLPTLSKSRPKYGPPKKNIVSYFYSHPQSAGFGEPPLDFSPDFQPPKPTYSQPPVDSYGLPLKTTLDEPYSTSEGFLEDQFDNHHQDLRQEFGSNAWHRDEHDQNFDNMNAHSKKRPAFLEPDANVFDNPGPNIDYNDNLHLKSYTDIFDYHKDNKKSKFAFERKKKPQHFRENLKYINGLWKTPHSSTEPNEEVIVGGQYAEPPARYVPKPQPSATMFFDNKQFNSHDSFVDSEVAVSATISPYVNYKNSNMAFSPQNLNDVFSIVDK